MKVNTYNMADNTDKLTIRLHIYDEDIAVNVLREEEALYRKGGKLINELLNAYYQTFKGRKSDKEISYYAMIDLALRLQRELQRNDTKPYEETLQQLTKEVEQVLGERK